MFSNTFNAFLAQATHQPLIQSFVIVIGTFILEDAATVLAAMRADEGMIPLPYAVGALYVGIVLGDLGLYGLGRLSARAGFFSRWVPSQSLRPAREWLEGRVGMAVLVSRFLPGMRLPTYTTCGYLGLPFGRFALAATVATLLWTSLLFLLSLSFGAVIMNHLGPWRWLGAIGFALGVVLLGRMAARLCEVRR